MIAAILFLAGLYALVKMPRREDPKITIHTGIVSAVYPGATAEQVEDQVTSKIEERLFRFEEVRRERTFSTTRNGAVVINVELNDSVTHPDVFWSKLRLDLAQLKATELPESVRGPVVDSDFGDTVAMLVAVHGGHYGPRDLKDYARTAEDALRTIPAVSKIKRIGDQKEEIDVSCSSQRLAQYSVDPQKVMRAVAGRNTVAYAGRVPAELNKVPVETDGSYRSEDELRHTIVDVSATGQPVYLGDVADIERVYKDPDEYVRFDGEPAILLSIEVHDGYNIVDAGAALRKTLASVQGSLPPDVKLDIVADQPRVVSDRILDFFREFGIAIVAVILVTMLLLPLRVALVSAVAIPVTVSITFAGLNALGVELQQVSISALIVVLGMVVDDAIIIADNYVELLDCGVPVDQAAWKCAIQMAVPVLTATLTIIGSFLPILLLVTGPMGEFIRSLPVAVSVALATSFIVAMLLTPITARAFIRTGLRTGARGGGDRVGKLALLDTMQRKYNKTIRWAMMHKRETLTGGALTLVVGAGILSLVPQLLFPLAERNQFVIDVWLPEGSRIEATDASVRRIEAALSREPLITSYASFLGASAPRFYYNVNPQAPASNYAQILVNTRQVKGTMPLVASLRPRLAEVAPEARVFVKGLQQGHVMEAPVEIRIVGPDAGELRRLGGQVEDVLLHTPGATYIHTDWHEDEWLMGVNVRQEEASRLGLTNAAIAQQLAGGFEGAPLTTFWEGDRPVDVVLRLDPQQRESFRNLADTYVRSPVTGANVPLDAIATLTPEWHPGRIVRRNGVRTLTVRAFPQENHLASQILHDARRDVDRMQLPPGYRIEYGGEAQNKAETYVELRRALVASLAVIFLILLLQFRTLVDPLIVMMAFPLALPGAAVGLLATHNTFGFTAFIGIVSLGGLAVRNSIILIDYIYERMDDGADLAQAAREAGERRLRPIFLTTMAAAIGVTPMILSGSSLWSPLASAIAFGLLGSMFFTLIVIPVLFVAVHRKTSHRTSAAAVAAVVAVLALMADAPAAGAQTERVTLDQAVALAIRQNATVKMALLKSTEMEAREREARADYFPVLSNESTAVHLGRADNLVIPGGILGTYPGTGAIPGANVAVPVGNQDFVLSQTTLAQPVTQILKIHAEVSAARADASLAGDNARQAEDEVALRMKELYYNLLTAERRREAARLHIEADEARLTEASDAVASGTALESKVLDGQAQLSEARHQRGSLEDAIADMRVEFNDLAGLPLDTDVELVIPEPESTTVPGQVSDLEAEALAGNPEVAAARAEVARARAGLSAARDEYIPDIGAYAQYVYQNGVPLLPENNGAVGLKINWTIGEFGKRVNEVRARRCQVDEAEENLRRAENRARIDIQEDLRRVRRAEEGLEAAREAVRAREEFERITANEVQAGTANLSDLRDAEAQTSEAEAGLFQAEMERSRARAVETKTLGLK